MTYLAHALAGLALILSFALLAQQRLRALLRLCAVQALTAALVVLLQRDPWLALFAMVAFALNGLLLPLVLAHRVGDERMTRAGPASWIGGVMLVAVSVATAMQVSAGGRVELLGCAFSVLLLGLMHSARSPTTGLVSAQNGLILLIAAIPHVSSPALVAVAFPIMPGAFALASRQAPMPGVLASWRFGAAISVASTTALFLLACAMLWQPPLRVWLFNVGPPNTYFVLLVGLVTMAASWLDLYEVRAPRAPCASFLLLTGAVVLALLADEPSATWLTFALALLVLAPSARDDGATFVPFAAAMLLALAGTLLLYLAAGSTAPAWSGVSLNGRTLNLAGIFLVLGYGALAAQGLLQRIETSAGSMLQAVGAALLATVPLLVMLRLRQHGLAPELLLALGLATLLVAAAGLWRGGDMAANHGVVALLGLVVFALGLGAANAALLLIALLGFVAMATHRSMPRFAGLLLAALPLLALYLLADATVARSIWLLLPLMMGAVAVSWACVAR